MKYEKGQIKNSFENGCDKRSGFGSEQQVALTLYGDAVHGPRDEGFGYSPGSAGQRSIFSWSQNKVPRRATDPIRGSWKRSRERINYRTHNPAGIWAWISYDTEEEGKWKK